MDDNLIDDRIGDWFEVYYLFPMGYGWIAPLKGAIKVGLGGISVSFKKQISDLLNRFLLHINGKIEVGKMGPVKSWQIPMGGPLKILTGKRSLLVGDAAGFVYPGTGEGIYYSIKSSQVASEIVKEAFKYNKFDQQFLQETYSRRLDKNNLLSLRDITFLEDVLVSEDTAERYIRRLSFLNSL